MSAIVYRDIPGKPRQYIHRIVHARLTLWTSNSAEAERMSERDATTVAYIMHQRSIGAKQHPPTEPAGEYGTEAL